MPTACPRTLRVLATVIAAAGPTGLASPAHAVETWVGANGEIHIVPGTEDPPPRVAIAPPGWQAPPQQPVAPAFRQAEPAPAKHAASPKTPKPAALSAVKPSAKPAEKPHRNPPPRAPARPDLARVPARHDLPRDQRIDPIRTGAITRKPDDPSDPQAPAKPARAQPQRPPYTPVDPNRPLDGPATGSDPGNARIIVDPAADTIQRTSEPETDFSASTDTSLAPDAAAASLYPTTPTPNVPTQMPGIRPVNPLRGAVTTIGGIRPAPTTTGTIVPSTIEQRTEATANGDQSSLPAVVVPRTTGSPQPVMPNGPASNNAMPTVAPPNPTSPVAPNPRRTVDDPLEDREATAYDQVGIQRGPFIWKPAVELSAGGTTNVQAAAGGTSSAALRVAPELIGQSNWSRHQLGLELRGSFTDYPQDWSLYRPTLNANVNGRVDFSDDSKLTLKLGYGFDKLPSTSALTAAGTTAAGLQSTYTGSAGYTRDMGLFAVTLRGEVDRTAYSLNQQQAAATNASGLDNTDFIGTLRGTYTMSQGLKPFLELQSDLRRYDAAAMDSTTLLPISHDTTGAVLRGGLTLDMGPILTGESSIGAGYEKPAASSLKTISAFTFDENLVWAPTRLTKVTFSTVSAIEPSLIAGASGAVSRTVGVKISNDLRRNLTIDLGGTYLFRHYSGIYRTENLAEITSGLTWKLSPSLQTFVRGTFDAFKSSAHTDDYTAASIYAGVRLQR